jgi:TM2 domain-containing membrane protein YozV
MSQPYYPRPMPTAPPKSAGVAAILSLIIPGLGHMYTGNPFQAMFWFGSAAISALLIAVGVGVFMLPCAWIGAILFAALSAGSFNRRHHVVR